jgi:hypothetical protein
MRRAAPHLREKEENGQKAQKISNHRPTFRGFLEEHLSLKGAF